ncbi:MAG TPA: RNA polymerase sigma factor [Acidimicrobiales bacterium]|nr:RNA polymerase sigma factor [Acidimicrobiales bacterium]
MKIDPEVVAAARDGDRSAMDALVRSTYAETYTLAHRLTGNEHDALDVTQDAYLRAWRALRRFRGDAQFSTWLYRITANCASSAMARRSRTRTDPLPVDADVRDDHPDADVERTVGAGFDRRVLGEAMARLPWRLRQVLVLREVYDLPHRTIAERLNITEAAAKVRLHRARRRLVADLTERGTAAAHGWVAAATERLGGTAAGGAPEPADGVDRAS